MTKGLLVLIAVLLTLGFAPATSWATAPALLCPPGTTYAGAVYYPDGNTIIYCWDGGGGGGGMPRFDTTISFGLWSRAWDDDDAAAYYASGTGVVFPFY